MPPPERPTTSTAGAALAAASSSRSMSRPSRARNRGLAIAYSSSGGGADQAASQHAAHETVAAPAALDAEARKLGRTEAERMVMLPVLLKFAMCLMGRWGKVLSPCFSLLIHSFLFDAPCECAYTTHEERDAHALAFARPHRCWFEQFELVSLGSWSLETSGTSVSAALNRTSTRKLAASQTGQAASESVLICQAAAPVQEYAPLEGGRVRPCQAHRDCCQRHDGLVCSLSAGCSQGAECGWRALHSNASPASHAACA
eukprot:3187165-Pleurochrysis_carterae.AAC.1